MDKIKRFFKYDFFIMLLDIVAVNAAYFGALLLRFSINNRMDPEREIIGTTASKPYISGIKFLQKIDYAHSFAFS